MRKIFLVVLLLTFGKHYSQTEKTNREAFELKLAVDSIHYYQQDVKVSPYFVKEKILQIYPSEKIFVEVELKKDTIFSMKVVHKVTNPEKTITIDFSQTIEGRKSNGMILDVQNPFKKILNYKAAMFVVGAKDWHETSILPVQPNLSGIEMWNDVIISLVLYDWTVKKE